MVAGELVVLEEAEIVYRKSYLALLLGPDVNVGKHQSLVKPLLGIGGEGKKHKYREQNEQSSFHNRYILPAKETKFGLKSKLLRNFFAFIIIKHTFAPDIYINVP